MIETDDLVRALKIHGYIVLRFTPTMWRARGPFGYVDFWPLLNKYLPQFGGKKAFVSQDLFATITEKLQPYEVMSDREWEATQQWQNGIKDLFLQYPQLSTCGKIDVR